MNSSHQAHVRKRTGHARPAPRVSEPCSFLHRLESENEVVELVVTDENVVNGLVFASAVDLNDCDERVLMSKFDRLSLSLGEVFNVREGHDLSPPVR